MALGFDWQRALQGLSQGLMQAGGPQGWSAFGPGMIQGQQYYDQQQQQKTMDEMRQLQAQALQQELEQQRSANTEKAAREKAINDLLGGGLMAPNGLSQAKFGGAQIQPGMMSGAFDPRQAAFLKAVGPDVAAPIIGEQLFKTAEAPETVGGMQFNSQTGQFEPIPGYAEQAQAIAAAGRAPIQPPAPPERVRLAQAAGLQPGTPEYQSFILGGGQNDEPADIKMMRLAGIDPGSPQGQALIKAKLSGGQGSEFKQANTLRDEYNQLTKDFRTVQDAYNKIKATSPTGAGDMSLLYSYVKLLDPGSVVRESEFATAAASGSFGEQVQGAAARIMSGERLPDTLRASFKSEADRIYQGQKIAYDNIAKGYADLAKRAGVDPKDVTPDYATPQPLPGDIPTQNNAPIPEELLLKYPFLRMRKPGGL